MNLLDFPIAKELCKVAGRIISPLPWHYRIRSGNKGIHSRCSSLLSATLHQGRMRYGVFPAGWPTVSTAGPCGQVGHAVGVGGVVLDGGIGMASFAFG